jgi:AraC-like DNA-binding protein
MDEPQFEILARDELRVIENVLNALPQYTDIGLDAGARCRLTSFGVIGLMMLCSRTIGEALSCAIRYQDLCYPLAQIVQHCDGPTVVLTLDASDYPERLRPYLIDQELAGFRAINTEVRGPRTAFKRLELSQPHPPHADRYAKLFGVKPQFEAPMDRIVVDADHYAQPLPQANTSVLTQLELDCQIALQRRRARVGVSGLIRDRLERAAGPIPTLETIAADLHMAPRTIRRTLTREGASFRELDIQTRRARATYLLETTTMTVDAISNHLGYTTTSTFTHAFKRWTGHTPSIWRTNATPRN